MSDWTCDTCGATNLTSRYNREGKNLCHQCEVKTHPEKNRFVCRECGDLDSTKGWLPGTVSLERSLCHTCEYWMALVAKYGPGSVVVDGVHHQYDPKQPWKGGNPSWLGFAGRPFCIQFKDGTTVRTNNLWFQGPIPERFRDRLPDNAQFVSAQP